MKVLGPMNLPSVIGTTVLLLALGCAEKPIEHTVKKIPPVNVTERVRQTKEQFEGELKAGLEKLDEEVAELKMRVSSLKAAARAELEEHLKEVETEQKAAKAKLEEVSKASGEAWEELREGAKNAWEELEKAVRDARSKL